MIRLRVHPPEPAGRCEKRLHGRIGGGSQDVVERQRRRLRIPASTGASDDWLNAASIPLLTSAAISPMEALRLGRVPELCQREPEIEQRLMVVATSAALISAVGVCALAECSSVTATAAATASQHLPPVEMERGQNRFVVHYVLPKT